MANRRNRSNRRNRNRNRRRTRNQRGGMSPFEYKDALLLDSATRMQAEVSGLDKFIAESQVMARQAGGSRHRSRRNRNRRSRSRQSRSRRSRNRKQKGGDLAEFRAGYELLPPGVPRGVNPQFTTEATVNSMYSEGRGAQY
jgi:hypothetical protein